MKALSIRQPWAHLIVTGEKPVENRSWNSTYTGHLLIHASLQFDKAGYQWVRRNFPHLKMPTPAKFALGAIVGMVDMVGCVVPGSADYHSPWYAGDYGFLMRNAKKLPEPVPFKGALGFFDVPDELVRSFVH